MELTKIKFLHNKNNRITNNVLLQRSSEVTVLQTEKLQHKAVYKTNCINVLLLFMDLKMLYLVPARMYYKQCRIYSLRQ